MARFERLRELAAAGLPPEEMARVEDLAARIEELLLPYSMSDNSLQ